MARGRRLTKTKKARGRRRSSSGPLGFQHTCHVYHILVDYRWYVGFTSRPVPIRIHEHLENSLEDKIDTLFYRTLRENNHEIDGLWYESYKNEYSALRAEQEEIEKLGGPKSLLCLNSTIGGEGTNIVLTKAGRPRPRKKPKR